MFFFRVIGAEVRWSIAGGARQAPGLLAEGENMERKSQTTLTKSIL
ncbi:hypothetical protein P4489_01430 [Heyndrickxia sporothermodurans]|nr:hypothetical protein [Heyndrickxia sporothermodurans]